MPILVRPVREQLEHDRVIRLLQSRWKKRADAEANVGDEQRASIKVGQVTLYPDLVVNSVSPKRLQVVIEVETGESVNNLEAMAQWAHMSRTKAAFQLYVPNGTVEQAKRLCEDHHVALAEMWCYLVLGEQVRFTLVHRNKALAEPLAKLVPEGRPDIELLSEADDRPPVAPEEPEVEAEEAPPEESVGEEAVVRQLQAAAPAPEPVTGARRVERSKSPAVAPAPPVARPAPAASSGARPTAAKPVQAAPKPAAAKAGTAAPGRPTARQAAVTRVSRSGGQRAAAGAGTTKTARKPAAAGPPPAKAAARAAKSPARAAAKPEDRGAAKNGRPVASARPSGGKSSAKRATGKVPPRSSSGKSSRPPETAVTRGVPKKAPARSASKDAARPARGTKRR